MECPGWLRWKEKEDRSIMTGNEILIKHLEELLADAKADKFDDFKTNIATPRLELNHRLQVIMRNNRDGVYDG